MTGGSTIILHHPGATSPNVNIAPETLKANIYINSKVLEEHEELHAVVAHITQLFVADYATPLANAFADTHTRHKWGNSTMVQTPTKGKAQTEEPIMPLIPCPILPTSAHFVFPGRPAGSLERLLSSSDHVLSHAPSIDNNTIVWKPHQIHLMQGRDLPSIQGHVTMAAIGVGGAQVGGVYEVLLYLYSADMA